MEAFSILPVKAIDQTATPQGTSQGPRGLGDVFGALLLEATNRLDARPADLASFDSRGSGGEPPRISAAETISSVDRTISSDDREDRRDDAGRRADSGEYGAVAARDPIEPIMPAEGHAEGYAEVTDDGEIADPAPQDDAEPYASVAGDQTPEPADGDIQLAEGEDAAVPAAQDRDDPAPEEIAAPAILPAQAQTAAALGAARALGPDPAAFVALARAATQAQVPGHAAEQAQAASTMVPAAGRFGTEVGATRVQVTPAAVVAQPNAALGGGAAVAAVAAEAGQANAQNGAQNAQAGLPNAASQIAASAATAGQDQIKPGNRGGLNNPAASSQAPTGDTANTTQGATTGQNGTGAANAAQGAAIAAEAAPGSGLQGQGQGAPIQGTTGEPGGTIPRNAQTAFTESNNQNAANAGPAGGLGSEAGVLNRLGLIATAQPLGAPVSGADDAAGAGGSQQPGASQTAAGATQGAHPAALESNQNNATQAARGNGSAPAGVAAKGAAQGAAQNTPSGTAAATEPAMAPASVQRAEGAGQANANNPAAAGTPGAIYAATNAPRTLPAQARPAAAPSLPANQVAVHIQRAVAAGQNRVSISLHPAELGQIDVKLNIGNDGAVRAIVSIERPETFELLQRDARGLEKALQDAGLKTDSGSLSFNLKGETGEDAAARREGAESGSQEAGTETPAEPELAPEMIVAANPGGIEHALDLHV